MKKLFLACALTVFGLSLLIHAQEARGVDSILAETTLTEAQITRQKSLNPQLAMSTPNYPVTAGDVYSLTYAAGNTAVQYLITVDTSYSIRVANLAVIDASGKTYTELKAQVESIVSRNYPLSGVQFVLTLPAVFRVAVRGEVKQTAEVEAWPLTRLSDVIAVHLTPWSSRRAVTVRSAGGRERVYDLFRASRDGDLGQNPFVRPGDVITIPRVDRVVSIAGAVERPGSYQLLPGETLSELIHYYASGFTDKADPTRIQITSLVDTDHLAGSRREVSVKDGLSEKLQHYDQVVVPAVDDLRPVVFFEGAIGAEIGTTPEASSRIPVTFLPGENYATLVRSHRNFFSAVSDTQNAYILREEKLIPLNLNPMLYDAAFRSEYAVEPYDVLMIPFRQYFVTVSGAVKVPGRYPYIPDRLWDYYVALAGGFDEEKNSGQKVSITTITGSRLKKGDPIEPETNITASSNSFLYYFGRYAPVATTTLSLLTTVFTFIAISQ